MADDPGAQAVTRIDAVDCTALWGDSVAPGFLISPSVAGAARTAVVADAATCDACVREIFDPTDRRFGYAFTNCMHCGPRLSILERVPYDRDNTTMGVFPMCAQCQAEFEDSANRRYHAQPTACPACGPQLWLETATGERLAVTPQAVVGAARRALQSGSILAIKGLGGFHLACDALDGDAVARLRTRKRRDQKPFALMARDLGVVRRFCALGPREVALLCGAGAPIVILPVHHNRRECVAPAVAPGLASLAFMLPHTPLHHLLLAQLDGPVVMTSGNLTDEPPCTANRQARRRLGPLVDLFVLHDRDIAHRVDDSVVRVIGGQARMLRRARGWAPAPRRLPAGFEKVPPILAMGAEFKNTFCLVKDGEAIVSQHFGDLGSAAAYAEFRNNLTLLAAMFAHAPVSIAVDRHPGYHSSKLGRARADAEALQLVPVQHHHAHVASTLADNHWPLAAPRVLGIALDGFGYGADDSLWGGEFLLADYARARRLARFKPVAMPGGELATHEAWRSTYAHLCAAIGWKRVESEFPRLEVRQLLASKPLALLDTMRDAGVNSPLASSCGRLFDAVAATLGLCRDRASYEAQPAVELEALAARASLEPHDGGYAFALTSGSGGLYELDPTPMWHVLLAELARGTPHALAAHRFHRGLGRALVGMTRVLAAAAGADGFDTVALTGDVFQNALLSVQVRDDLETAGFRVLMQREFPCHDGGISFGQAVVAAAQALRPVTAPGVRQRTDHA
jgi:hydrogenase maturation protein HypF